MINSALLRVRLREKGITQTELANKIGIAPATVSQKINNIRPFSLNEAGIVSDALEISPDEFGDFFFAKELRSAKDGHSIQTVSA